MEFLQLLLVGVLVFFSAFLSASEIALFSLSRFQLKLLKDRFRPSYKKIKKLISDPSGMLMTILMINELINISLSTLMTGIINRNLDLENRPFQSIPNWLFQTLVGVAATTPIILLFCEITPKVLAARANQIVAPLSASPMLALYEYLRPLRFLLKKILNFLLKLIGQEGKVTGGHSDPSFETNKLQEADFLSLLEEGQKEGTIEQDELDLIRNVFDMDNTPVSEVMTPMTEVFSLPNNTTIEQALKIIRSHPPASRIPVTNNNHANGAKTILGVVYAKEAVLAALKPEILQDPVTTLMRKAMTVTDKTFLNTAFRKMKKNRTHLAVVLPAYLSNNSGSLPSNEPVGIITMTDIMHALFEDIYLEGDEAE